MSNAVVEVDGVGKRFFLGQDASYGRLSEVLQAAATGWWKRDRSNRDAATGRQFWALREISFTVAQGDVLGIIGRNGAGKSTLLKILSRITRPTEGRIGTRGRVGSLLEVGTGFHPELTGRENVFLNGSILGMTRREIERRFDEIVAFAEIDDFLDTPVKRYSSGMYTRLAFSVAAHLEPEILIVDEVLAVGDIAFQKKCLGKMRDVADHGRTVLFVSHNMTAISNICTHGLLLDQGRCLGQGAIEPLLRTYFEQNADAGQAERKWSRENAPGADFLQLLEIAARPVTGDTLSVASGIELVLRFRVAQPEIESRCALQVETSDAVLVFQQVLSWSEVTEMAPSMVEIRGQIPPNTLNKGQYRVNLLINEHLVSYCIRLWHVIEFELSNVGASAGVIPNPGILSPKIHWQYECCPLELT